MEFDKIIKESINNFLLNEIKHLAEKSHVTVCSLEDFCSLCESLGINDSNVDEFDGEYAFIEIGSTRERCEFDAFWGGNKKWNNDGGKFFDEGGQFYFKYNGHDENHPNVLHLIFDDNVSVLTKQDGKATSVSLNRAREIRPELQFSRKKLNGPLKRYSEDELEWNYKNGERKPNNQGKTNDLEYWGGKAFDHQMASVAHKFIEDNIEKSNGNVKFILHCAMGASRSGAMGYYIAQRLHKFADMSYEEYMDNYLSEYDYEDETGKHSQFAYNMKIKPDGKIKQHMLNHRVLSTMLDYDEKHDPNGQWKGDLTDAYLTDKRFGKTYEPLRTHWKKDNLQPKH